MADRIWTAFVDRDGVINRKADGGGYIRAWDEFQFLPGAVEALAILRATGARVIVVTNQRGVARGLVSPESLEDIHRQMNDYLAERNAHVAAILVCPHARDECDCRKPKTGLYDKARRLFPDVDPATSIVIGDSLTDIEFGNRIGARSYLVGDATSRASLSDTSQELVVEAQAQSLLALVRERLAGSLGTDARASGTGPA